MSLFRKPKRNVRQRQADDDDADDVDAQVEEDPGLRELQTSIAKFKEKKASKNEKKKNVKNTFDDDDKEDKKAAAQLLSFDEDLLTGGLFRTIGPYSFVGTCFSKRYRHNCWGNLIALLFITDMV